MRQDCAEYVELLTRARKELHSSQEEVERRGEEVWEMGMECAEGAALLASASEKLEASNDELEKRRQEVQELRLEHSAVETTVSKPRSMVLANREIRPL